MYIATTHDSHAELARRAIEHGIPVLLEKAFTMDAAEAEELFALARDRGAFLMEAMWMRFNPAVRRVAELLADGAIGEPRHLAASFGFPVGDPGHRLWDPVHGGGSAGRIRILPAFWGADAFVIERPLGGIELDVEEVRMPKVGNGYVPMLEAVADALRDGRLEHELSSHAATLRVMRAVDAVLAQV